MRIHLLTVGNRMPGWIAHGYREYAKRLPEQCKLCLTEIQAVKRTKGVDRERAVAREGERLLAALPGNARVLALERSGVAWTTEELAGALDDWLLDGRDTALMVGGADGLAAQCLQRAERRWSLSPLTLPHPLVRILVAEQLYRAWSIRHGHPYHR